MEVCSSQQAQAVTPLLRYSKNLPRWPVGAASHFVGRSTSVSSAISIGASRGLRLRNRTIQLQESSSVHTVAASCSSVNTTLLENMATCTLQISIAMIQSHLYVPTIQSQTSKNSIQSVTQTLPTKETYTTPRKNANSDAQDSGEAQHL